VILPTVISLLFVSQPEMEFARGAPSADLVSKKLGIDLNELAVIRDDQRDDVREAGRDVICLCGTCPREPITDCRCGWAGMNRDTIQHLVSRGWDRERIKEVYREAYGEKVLAMVPGDGFAQTAWILPYSAAVLALIGLFFFGWRYKRRMANRAELPPDLQGRQDVQQDLARELRELD
jgi:cytochrome c-type biogenesis protein CcmH